MSRVGSKAGRVPSIASPIGAVPRNPALQVRLPAEAFERLVSFRSHRHLNVFAWARHALLEALERDFPEPPASPDFPRKDGGPDPGSPLAPLPGWRPDQQIDRLAPPMDIAVPRQPCLRR